MDPEKIEQFRTLKQEINTAYQSEDFDKVKQLLDRGLETYPGASFLHLVKGIVLQVADEEGEEDLEEILSSFAAAEAFGMGTHHPILETAHYQYSFLDDTKLALKEFEKVEAQIEDQLFEAMVGQVRCLKELKRISESRKIIQAIKTRFPHREEVNFND